MVDAVSCLLGYVVESNFRDGYGECVAVNGCDVDLGTPMSTMIRVNAHADSITAQSLVFTAAPSPPDYAAPARLRHGNDGAAHGYR